MNVWFTKGFNNLYYAMKDIKAEISDCKILCTHSNPSFLGFQSSDFHEIEPYFRSKKQFLSYCLDMIEKYDIKVIFPHHKQEWFNEFSEVFTEKGVVVATVAPLKGVNEINHKNKFYKRISKIKGVNAPTFGIFKTYEEFKVLSKSSLFNKMQLCIKPSLGVYGSDFYDLKKPLSKQKMNKVLARNSKMLLMQYLDGFEYSADCVAYHGELVGFVVRKKISPNSPQLIVNDPVINKQVKLLVETLGLNSMFNIQFKELNGVPYVLEINPRLAGRSYYATLAGLNIPAIATQLFLNIKNTEDIVYNIQYGTKILNIPSAIIVEKNTSYVQCKMERQSQ